MITYSMVMLKPVLPYITDFFAHALFFKDHMLTVHAHQGKYHAHAAVAEGAKNDQSEKATSNFKKGSQDADHIITPITSGSVVKIFTKTFPLFTCSLHTVVSSLDYPPPRLMFIS